MLAPLTLVGVARSLDAQLPEERIHSLCLLEQYHADLDADTNRHIDLQYCDFFGIELLILPERHIDILHE